jgi:zinc/manganese transport system permease protein
VTTTFVAIPIGYQSDWWPILGSAFMRHALVGGTIVALAAGLLGYFIVVRRTAFAAHASAHIGLPGATGAVLLGLPPVLGLGVFCVGGAVVIGLLGKRAAERDVATGITLAFATGLGLFFNSLARKNSSTMTNVLFGNLLAISADQLLTFAALLLLLAVSVGIAYRPLLYSSINAAVAEAKGVPVRFLSVLFMVLLGLAVTMAVQAVGTLLLFALLIATAVSVGSVWIGLAASAMFNFPPSFLIVTIACGIWLIIWLTDCAWSVERPPMTPGAPTLTSPVSKRSRSGD